MRIITSGIIQQVSSNGSGKRVSVATDGTTHEVECDAILVSVGRKPNLEGLELDIAAVDYTLPRSRRRQSATDDQPQSLCCR